MGFIFGLYIRIFCIWSVFFARPGNVWHLKTVIPMLYRKTHSLRVETSFYWLTSLIIFYGCGSLIIQSNHHFLKRFQGFEIIPIKDKKTYKNWLGTSSLPQNKAPHQSMCQSVGPEYFILFATFRRYLGKTHTSPSMYHIYIYMYIYIYVPRPSNGSRSGTLLTLVS